MKRTILFVLLLLVVTGAFAQARLDAVAPKDARTLAMGGAFVAMSTGYQSLYGNPAAFADKTIDLTLASATMWTYFMPTQANVAAAQELVSAIESMNESEDGLATVISGMSDFITGNGLGAGAAVGLGWVGKGLGIGVIANGEAYLSGPNVLGAVGTVDAQVAGVVGVGLPLELFGLRLSVGGDIRPYVRLTGDIGSNELFTLMGMGSGTETVDNPFMSLPLDMGFGLAVDIGARLDLGSLLSVGLAIRDITTKQNYSQTTVGELTDALSAGNLPGFGDEIAYAVIPNITLGVSVRPIPDGLRKVIDVELIGEIQDPITVYLDHAQFWNVLHVGAEADLLGGLLSVRAGLNKGWISFGAGIKLLIAEVNIALFTEELGRRPGDHPRTGVALEGAIRF